MEYKDTFKTIQAPVEGIYKEKGSKFLAYAFPVSSDQQIKEILTQLKKEHHSARHHCFAWRLGPDNHSFRLNDDGEPSGTAGRPILGQIQHQELTDILIVVVRYFGGILLGTSGLTNAYKLAAADVLNNSIIIVKIITNLIEINFDYLAMNELMHVLKDFGIEITESHFDLKCRVKIMVRKELAATVMEKLNKIENVNALINLDK